MSRYISSLLYLYLIIISGFLNFSFAFSAVQTDWSGGPEVLGPVTSLGDEFHLDTGSICYQSAGVISLGAFYSGCTVDSCFITACDIHLNDVNGDGNMDIIAAAMDADEIAWWTQVDEFALEWSKQTIANDFECVRSVHSADIDGDGDCDVLGGSIDEHMVSWWENVDGSGTQWVEHPIVYGFNGAHSVMGFDIDGDGDVDVIGASHADDFIWWWENVDGSGENWTTHVVENYFPSPTDLYCADIDGDADLDVVASGDSEGYINWWENVNGTGCSWVQHEIVSGFFMAYSVYPEDMDLDGDMDVAGAAYYKDEFAWWENLDGVGGEWQYHLVAAAKDGAVCIRAADIDQDGDSDLIGVSWAEIYWWENSDGVGNNWIENVVKTNFNGGLSAVSGDLNGDGFPDIAGVASNLSDVAWWDPGNYVFETSASLQSSILSIGSDPDWDYLEWSTVEPSGSSVSVQIRASDDWTNLGDWSDTLYASCALEGILEDGDSFLQYRTHMETSNLSVTPVLEWIQISWDPLSIEDTTSPIQAGVFLFLITPNPIRGSFAIEFCLADPAEILLSIFDVTGRLVIKRQEHYSSGYHQLLFDKQIPGIYFCRMSSGEFTDIQRFTVTE